MTSTSLRINPESLSKPNGYSHVAAGKGIHVSVAGQVAVDKDGNKVGTGNFGAQVEQVFANVEAALAAVGATFKSLLHLTIYCVGSVQPQDLVQLREPLKRRIEEGEPPPITLVFVSRLLDADWLVEVQANAAVDEIRS